MKRLLAKIIGREREFYQEEANSKQVITEATEARRDAQATIDMVIEARKHRIRTEERSLARVRRR